ncbi:MAG: trigger factor family protein, partial [Actinobacteria bacterium]|nr:trigger factor family protein [Actinomycetota bacterium]
MHVNSKNQSPTKVTLTITADNDDLKQSKKAVLQEFAKDASIAGFR